jgi:multidrug efflux pump subunit AcrB
MTLSQFFVYRKPIAWTAMVATLAWGTYAYLSMPQRQDPIIPVLKAVVVTLYPGATAEKVEQEVTRKIERKVAENPKVEHVYSISRPSLSIVYVELIETLKDAELVWQDIRGKLSEIPDLPRVGPYPTRPYLNKDFGDTVAVMLTISSPPVSDLEIKLRADSIRNALLAHRQTAPAQASAERWTGVLVYPQTLDRSFVLRIGRTLGQRLTEAGVAGNVAIVEAPSTGMLEVTLRAGHTLADIQRVVTDWEREEVGAGESHPDLWPEFWNHDLNELETQLRQHACDKYTYRELKDFADRIRDRLKQSSNVAQIDEVGAQNEQVTLAYSGQRFNQLGITPLSVITRIQQQNTNAPGGRIELPEQNVAVRPFGEYTSAAEIGQTVMDVSADGYPLYLRDQVEINRGYEDPAGVMNFRTIKVDSAGLPLTTPEQKSGHEAGGKAANGPDDYNLQSGRAITISVRQVKGTTIADLDRDINAALTDLTPVLPQDLRVDRTSNEPFEVRHKIREFDRNLIEAIVIVVAVALVFMEWRSAVLVAVSIPVTVAMTLGLCQMVGVDLQQVSIAALIIALGLLVDAPVVAADAINRELAHGQPRHIAAWLGPRRLARAVFYATLTNTVAFLPLLLVQGKTGNFIWSLPIVVSASLFASMIVAWTLAPLLGYYVLKGQKGFDAHASQPGKGARFPRAYKAFVEACIAHRLLASGVALLVLAGGAGLAHRIGTQFFPKDLHDVFTVNLYLPEGSPIRETRNVAMSAIRELDALEGQHIASYTTFVGAGGPRFWLSVEPQQRADNYAQILVHTASKQETAAVVGRLKEVLPTRIAEARLTIEQLETGPPIGVPVQVRLYGSDMETLRALAAQVKQHMRAIPGTTNIHDDWGDPVFQLALNFTADRASITGLTNEEVAAMVGTGLSGLPVTQLRENDKLIDITLRLRPSERSRIDNLLDLNVASAMTGVRVPLRQVASVTPQLVAPKIRRRDHERCLTVLCDAVPGVLPSTIVERLREVLPPARGTARQSENGNRIALPPTYDWEFGGEAYEQAKGFKSISVALIVSVVAIYLALVLQFNSVTQPLLIYAAVPFGMVGGLIGLLVFGAPFGFMAFLGIASLAGLIISHVIVLFDFIDEMHHKGEPLRKAVVDAGLARLRPVVVTVLATVGGLIPLALEGGPLWEPMCYVQIAGMLVATLVTLVLVPVLYVVAVEDLRLVKWDRKASDQLPSAEELARLDSAR